MIALQKGAEIEVEIESLAFGGDGVGRVDGMVIFVAGGIPGQRVRARIFRKKKAHALAQLVAVVRQSPDFVAPRCAHLPDCGGCTSQHYAYAQQLAAKTSQVRETLEHLGKFENPVILPILPSPEPFYYRNKMEYTFSDARWLPRSEVAAGRAAGQRDFALGLHISGRFDKILAIEHCWLQSERSNTIRNFVAAQTIGSAHKPYTTRDHSGFWRFLVIREGKNTGELLVNLVTADRGTAALREVEALAAGLNKTFPEITSIVHTINRSKAQVATGEETRVLHGPGFIHETIGKWRFRISANSFFQTNSLGAEILYRTATEFAGLSGTETVYDFYCGAGTIAIYLSERARQVVGIEIVPEAIADARINAALNGVENCIFFAGDLKDELVEPATFVSAHGAPDVVIFDPPRAGLHPKVVERILVLAPDRIVYVSCNPATFARDAQLFCDGGYRLVKSQPVDMFPHTPHIELVSLLQKATTG